MNTTGHPEGQESSNFATEATGTRGDTLAVVLLILTILVLTGAAAGIAIGFPQALEIIAVQAHAAVAVAADAQAPRHEDQSADDNDEETEPFFADDIRNATAVYAGCCAGAPARSAPEAPAAS